MGWALVIVIIAALLVIASVAFWWFRSYRFTDNWRKGELRGAMLGFLMWFGGIFGHRLPPPPQARVEFAAGGPKDRGEPDGSGGPAFPDDVADQE